MTFGFCHYWSRFYSFRALVFSHNFAIVCRRFESPFCRHPLYTFFLNLPPLFSNVFLQYCTNEICHNYKNNLKRESYFFMFGRLQNVTCFFISKTFIVITRHLLSKEHYCKKIHTLIKITAYPYFYRQPSPLYGLASRFYKKISNLLFMVFQNLNPL